MGLLKRFVILFCLVPNILFSKTIYVKVAGSDANTGGSWGQAYKTLQKAIAISTAGDEIWVAKGTYYPDEGNGLTNNDRGLSFNIKTAVGIYGGFAGTETSLAQRNWKTNVTTLTGEIQQDANFSNNAYHVIVSINVSEITVVDGFSITGGNANGTGADRSGGGWLNNGSGSGNSSVPTINNCIFSGNAATDFGGGILNYGPQGDASPVLLNCTFENNTCAMSGGAVFNYGQSGLSNPSFTNCVFLNNTSVYGGAIYNSGYQGISITTVTNCCFSGNSCTNLGGAMVNDGEEGFCKVDIVNCTYGSNTALYGGAVINLGSNGNCTVKLVNSILWNNSPDEIFNQDVNPSVIFSIVKGGYPGQGNINADPLFTNADGGNLRIEICSPAIDAGDNASITQNLDADGNPRIQNNNVDLGAYEYQGSFNTVVYVNKLATGMNNGKSWLNAFTSLQNALTYALRCKQAKQIWVAKGTYYPDEGLGFTNNDRQVYFMLVNGVAIYGGFTGTESSLGQRNWKTHVTTLSGEIQQDNDTSNNAYHVVWCEYAGNLTTLDGFTITGGHAGGPDGGPLMNNWLGAGLVNNGAGDDNFSNPTIANCDFISNTAAVAAGAIYNAGFGGGMANPVIINCRFIQNEAKGKLDGGGAIYNDALNSGTANPSIINCIFTGNTAVSAGAGILNIRSGGSSNPVITNCSFYNNTAPGGGAIYNYSGFPVITNSIFWNNGNNEIESQEAGAPSISYSIVKGGYAGTGNINNDPLFMNAASGNLRLQACSPAVDAGNNGSVVDAADIDGNPRIKNGNVDMGAYELQSGSCCPPGDVIYVNINAAGQNNGNNWTDAFTSLQDALSRAVSCGSVTQVWVAKGTYYTDEGYGLPGNDRNLSFNLKTGIALYGGFTGTESNLSQRNGKVNITILSGDIQQDNIKTNNAYFVVKAGPSVNTILDGFTIAGGTGN